MVENATWVNNDSYSWLRNHTDHNNMREMDQPAMLTEEVSQLVLRSSLHAGNEPRKWGDRPCVQNTGHMPPEEQKRSVDDPIDGLINVLQHLLKHTKHCKWNKELIEKNSSVFSSHAYYFPLLKEAKEVKSSTWSLPINISFPVKDLWTSSPQTGDRLHCVWWFKP